MKKFIISVMLVAAVLAANVSAQTVVGGGQQTADSGKTVVSKSADSGFDLGLNVNTWNDVWIRAKVLGLSSDELADASDSDKDKQVDGSFEGTFGAKALLGDVFYLKGQAFYGLGRTGLDFATGILGIGAQLGKFSIGANFGMPLMTLRGFNLGADVSIELVPSWYLYGWGNFLINTGDYKNDIISTAGVWTKGTKNYTAWDAGVGTEYTSADGLYLSGQVGVSADNNEYVVTDSANKVMMATNALVKIGVVAGNGSIFYTGLGIVSGEDIVLADTKDWSKSNKYQILFGFKKN